MDVPGALLVLFGVFFAFALAGLVTSCAYQYREWRRRRAITKAGR